VEAADETPPRCDPCYELLKKLNDGAMNCDERGKPMKMGEMGNGPQQFTAMIIDAL
jgi:hypothetical protein